MRRIVISLWAVASLLVFSLESAAQGGRGADGGNSKSLAESARAPKDGKDKETSVSEQTTVEAKAQPLGGDAPTAEDYAPNSPSKKKASYGAIDYQQEEIDGTQTPADYVD